MLICILIALLLKNLVCQIKIYVCCCFVTSIIWSEKWKALQKNFGDKKGVLKEKTALIFSKYQFLGSTFVFLDTFLIKLEMQLLFVNKL